MKPLLDVPRILPLFLVAWRQVRRTKGALGASLRAEPLRHTFRALSARESEKATAGFDRTAPYAVAVGGPRGPVRRLPAESEVAR